MPLNSYITFLLTGSLENIAFVTVSVGQNNSNKMGVDRGF